MPDLTDDDLTELRRLHEAATPGLWRTDLTDTGCVDIESTQPVRLLGFLYAPSDTGNENAEADAELLVAMRNALPGLLAEVERLRAAAPASEDVPPAVAADLTAHGPMPYAPGISDVAGSPPPTPAPTPEAVAQAFHEAYERLAPSFGYETREASAVPWPEVPENNRRLMTAVAAEVMALLSEPAPPSGETAS